jgi:hypothetical protein
MFPEDVAPNTIVMSLAQLANVPYSETSNMLRSQTKNIFIELSEGNQWTDIDDPQYQTMRNENLVYAIFTGMNTTAVVTIRISYAFGASLSPAGQAFATGMIPDFGEYTVPYLDFLRKRFPNIVNWPQSNVRELCGIIMSTDSDRYDDLVQAVSSYNYEHPYQLTVTADQHQIQQLE